MKKYLNFAYVGAIALLGAGGFTACSSDDALVEEQPTNAAITQADREGEVLTNFVFNVSNGNTATTRMSEDATQASSNLAANKFRGIDNSYIMCFKDAEESPYVKTAITAAKNISMARVVAAGSLSNTESRRVLEMSLPLNTNKMMFYGKAILTDDSHTSRNTYGHLDDFTVTDNLANANFQLGKRLDSDDNKTKFQEVQKLLAGVLSCVMNTSRNGEAISATQAPEEDVKPYGFDIPGTTKPNLKWEDYKLTESAYDGGTPRQLEIKLAKAYKELTTVQTAELRNASGYALKETTKNLWSIINSVRCAEPTDEAEAMAKFMAQKINVELGKYFNGNVPVTGASVTGVSIKDATVLISVFEADTYWPTTTAGAKPAASTFNEIASYSGTDFGKYPEQFDLPQGSTHIKFDGDKKTFYYVENYNSSAVGGQPFTVDDYYYPAELCYFGNSLLRVSDTEHVVTDYPASVTTWNTNATTSWPSDWSVNSVQSSTRSVAMKNDINYGTSLLKTTVGYNVLTLKDNNHTIQQRDYGVDEPDKTINVTGTSFKLVGVIIGDQWPKVGWNFLPKTSDADPNYRKGYVYDNQITNNGVIPASTTSASEPNYTLAFDNYQDMRNAVPADPENKQAKVYIALEFENNTGIDFFGKDNLITNGSRFYLVGELDPTSKTGPAKPEWHALPPYDASQYGDETKTVPRVFIQDHMTTANFKLGVNSLQYAYLTVPDLRSSSVTLGLSVDLQWSTGLSFDNILLGGE